MQFREIFCVYIKNRIKYTGAVRGKMWSFLLWQTSTAVFLTICGVECLNVRVDQEQGDVELDEFHFST
jgi:hypothetical protein